MLRIIVLLVAISTAGMAYGQKKKDSIKDYLPTDNVDVRSEDNKRKNSPKRKHYRQIIKNGTKNILYGNPCAVEATRKMGFEYVVQSKNAPGSIKEFRRFWNNIRVKTRLFFLRSPFWKAILKGKFRKCRIKSGDKVG